MKNFQNLNKFKSPKHQRGDFLLGLMIAVIIAAVLSASYWIDARDSKRADTIKATIKAVNLTANKLQSNFGVTGQYGDVTTAVAVQSGTIPSDQRIRGTNTAQNGFGGLITAAPATVTSNNDVINLAYANVAPWACSEIVIGTQNAARRITVGATTVKALDGVISTTDMTAACDVDDPVAITWAVGRAGS